MYGKLENGNLVTIGLIVSHKKDSIFYEEKQKIEEKGPVKKIIGLRKNKFGYTGDDGILKIMAEKEVENDDTIIPGNNNEENVKGLKYQKICELKRHQGKINYMYDTGGAKGTKIDHYINLWKPDRENEYALSNIKWT